MQHNILHLRTTHPSVTRRGGAVIIVVLALLSLMIFLGVFFFEFVQEELTAAGNYKTNPYDDLLNPDEYFEEADNQLIIGPDAGRIMSALSAGDNFTTSPPPGLSDGLPGTPHSLVAHVLGRVSPILQPSDVLPHNGHGITTIVAVDADDNGIIDDNDVFDVNTLIADLTDGAGIISPWNDVNGDGNFDYATATAPNYEGDCVLFDMDGDTVPDATLYPLDPTEFSTLSTLPIMGINFSRPAQVDPHFDAFAQPNLSNALRPFQPDVDYTYPDINNLFLAYDRIDQATGRRILVPSFHRPDLFPQLRDANVPLAQEATQTFRGLYTQAATQRLVLRPHANHKYPDGTDRFLSTYTQAQSGNRDRFIAPFPFEVDQNGNGRFNEMGVYSHDSSQAVPADRLGWSYDLDVDLTGDGEPDGIWIDLGRDLVEMADGRQFVPLFSYYILDADGLINLNAHGNLRDGYFDGSIDYTAAPFSISNTGASASEVNPIRALTGNPADFAGRSDLNFVQQEHRYVFGFPLDTPQPQAAMANMELSFFLRGRPLSRSGSPLTGRSGEEALVDDTLPSAPRPGYTGASGFDDDSDDGPDADRYRGGAKRYPALGLHDPRLGGEAQVVIPFASHPVDPHGSGGSVYSATGRDVVAGVSGSPVVWPSYPEGWEAPDSSTIPGGAVAPVESPYPYGTPVPFTTSIFDNGTTSMIDEEDETRLASPDRRADDIFVPDENLGLHVSDSDYLRVGGTSRLKNLAPFNFNYSRDAAYIRKQFTTDSWDLSELTYTPWRYDAMNGRLETSEWVPASLVPPVSAARRFFPPEFGNTLFTELDPIRPEVRALLALEESAYPEAGFTVPSRRESFDLSKVPTYTLTPSIIDTVTPATIDSNDKVTLWRQPLNLNKLLVGFNSEGNPIYRDLMPHPDMYETFKTTSNPTITIPTPMIHDHDAAIPTGAELANITTGTLEQKVTAQEWWARYDRQRMTRDIYTLLYLIGAPNNGTNPSVDPGATVYPEPEKIREMAQFAVNYVDALDRDDVITKFEYDDDLSNGWDAPTKHVYGIERASLSFSEVQFLQTKPRSNLSTTLHDESLNVHQYLHMELRNSSPFQVDLAEGWRISRVKRDASGKATGTRDISVQFRTKDFGAGTANAKFVPPGGNFLIGTHDGHVVNSSGANICSDLYADFENDNKLELILPSSTVAAINTVPDDSANPNPVTNLDIGVDSAHPHYPYFTHVAGAGLPDSTYQDPSPSDPKYLPVPDRLVRQLSGNAMSMTPATPEVNLVFDLVLERRQNLHGVIGGGDESSMGDWIEVDRFQVRSEDMSTTTPDDEAILEIASPGAQADVLAGLTNLHSVERRQPFDPVQFEHANGSARNHTMAVTAVSVASHAANSAFTGTSFTLWQPHFDRDFTSAYELLSVPLYGNWPLTEMSVAGNTNDGSGTNEFLKEIHGGTQFNLAPGSDGAGSGQMSGDFTAGVRFNFPNGIPGKPYQGWNPYNYQNAWYRLFDFVTVPRRADQQSEEIVTGVPGSTKPVFRVPGKINFNTLRDETVLAALLDDETHLSYGNAYATQDNVTAGRNWYLELLQSRDGVDYFANAAGLPALAIPNSIDSRPFRNSSKPDPYATATVDDGVENGLLRSSTRRGATTFDPRPDGVAYSTPSLTSPTNFTSTGLWSGSPPHDTSSVNWQGLLDAGDLANTGLDHHTRNRILAKIANNSTTKSHVFFVWTAVGYFEAHRESTNNRVQIGARLTDIPIHRRFSVVDMSKIDEAYNTSSNTFEASKFIIFQKRLR